MSCSKQKYVNVGLKLALEEAESFVHGSVDRRRRRMASENIDNQRYYAEILRFLQNSGETSDDPYFVEKHWVKIHASNYFVKTSKNVYLNFFF